VLRKKRVGGGYFKGASYQDPLKERTSLPWTGKVKVAGGGKGERMTRSVVAGGGQMKLT